VHFSLPELVKALWQTQVSHQPLQGWRQSILKAAQLLRDRFGNRRRRGGALRARRVARVLDRRAHGRLQKELGEATRKAALTERPSGARANGGSDRRRSIGPAGRVAGTPQGQTAPGGRRTRGSRMIARPHAPHPGGVTPCSASLRRSSSTWRSAGLAQSTAINGTIEGTVKDQRGALLPGVTCGLNIAPATASCHRKRPLRASLLSLGTYRRADCRVPKFEQTGVTLRAGQTAVIDVSSPSARWSKP
jgi:hypothetical protein